MEDEEYRKFRWLRRNYGVLTAVAKAMGVSTQAVNRVFWGKSTSKEITRKLREKGAPLNGSRRQQTTQRRKK